ncbi:MAG: acetoin utilization protein AcuC [Gammaproteobacteria bacterium]|nr:acetoin utilization protein AcuC [Gammaproteobacteria bacterium]
MGNRGMIGVYHGEALARYGFGEGHPFGPDRLDAFWRETVRQGLDRRVTLLDPRDCNHEALARFHTADYLALVQQQSVTGTGFLDYGDTPAFRGVWEAGSTVVGSGLDALSRIMDGQVAKVFVPIAGLHHARRDRAAGFCVFNDPGVLIETLRALHGVRRIAYVDIDAHHGDGVFYAFEADPDVCIADIHEDGHYLYPGTGFADETGTGEARGTKLNIPAPPGADDRFFARAWPRALEFVRAARPEFIILQAGADSVAGDPITHMRFTPAAHARAARDLAAVADEFSDGRMIVTGGGGYNRNNLALAWNGVVSALLK